MNGCRPLQDTELDKLLSQADPMLAALLSLGVRTGFRITELLSLTWGSVLNTDGSIKDAIEVPRRAVKGKTKSRRVPLHPDCKARLITLTRAKYTGDATSLVFPMHRSTAHRQLKKALTLAGIKEDNGRVATHSMRKSFAKKMYEGLSGDLFKLQQAMGHANINSTVKYLQADAEEIEDAIRRMK